MGSWCAAFLLRAGSDGSLAPGLGGGQPFAFPVERLAFGLLLCFLLAWAAALLIRRYRGVDGKRGSPGITFLPGGAPRRLHVIETRRTGGMSEVSLIACDGHEYLVAFTAGQAILLRATEPGSAAGRDTDASEQDL